ncbi:hypothetical protein THRCLA_11825 [Thraustotheca clavata]|uniref:Uncharacterized protein n=1 Tax=Thraustotheca clavata TaxID=74557 RepID=A0A1V9Y6M1_9STRA|nr:hypothetical protein THRCLA_11825 [Thraustotheca clavata]
MNKLTNVESQRVMAVLGDMLDRLNFLTYVPVKVDYRLLGLLHENGCSGAATSLEQQWQLEQVPTNNDVVQKIKTATRTLCRQLRENPVLVNTFFSMSNSTKDEELVILIKCLSELTDLAFNKLGKTVEEETTRQELMDNIYNRRKQAEDELVHLREKLNELRKAKEDETSQLELQLQKLKDELNTINKNTSNELAMIQNQVKETLDKAFEKQNIDMQMLTEQHTQLQAKLDKDTAEHREIEDGLRKFKCKIGTEVANAIEKYDKDMSALAQEIDSIQSQYKIELAQIQELSEHFKKIDEEQRRINEEEKILEAARAEERRQAQILHDAATKIQKVFRGRAVRKELAAKKKGKKGGKDKKMADRFEILEETSHAPEHKREENALNQAMEELSIDTKDVKLASEAKEEGNKYFKEGRYLDAYDLYTKAIELCPVEEDYAYNRAVYSSNRSACLFHLGRTEECIDDCSVAIELSPKYVKAYLRRAQAYEKLDKLEEALKDVKSVLEIDPKIQSAIDSEKRLTAIVTERQEKMKAEMLEKLKGFGNTILGKFGLSTDNFQMVQDPATGSYNINFTQNKKP